MIWTNYHTKKSLELETKTMRHKTGTEDFRKMFIPLLQSNPVILVFAEPILSSHILFDEPRYFTKTKTLGATTHRLYSIEDPLPLLYSMSGISWRCITLSPNAARFAVPALDNESLFLMLDEIINRKYYRHDDIIVKTYTSVAKKHPKVVGILSAFRLHWKDEQNKKTILIRSGRTETPVLLWNGAIMLYSRTSPVLTVSTLTHSESIRLTNVSKAVGGNMQLVVVAPRNSLNIHTITFIYVELDAYIWKLDKIIVAPRREKVSGPNTTLRLRSVAVLKVIDDSYNLESYRGMSYHCYSEIVFYSRQHNVQIKFTSLQTQPGLKELRFSSSVDCEDVINTISVMFILLASGYVTLIIFVLKLLGNIQVHQHYEDPNEPTLVVRTETL